MVKLRGILTASTAVDKNKNQSQLSPVKPNRQLRHMFVTIAVFALASIFVSYTYAQSGPALPQIVQADVLAEDARQLGIDISKINLLYQPPPHDNPNVSGMFIPPNTIYVSPAHNTFSTNYRQRVLAHEYIHYQFERYTTSASDEFRRGYLAAVESYPQLAVRMNAYHEQKLKSKEFFEEAFAILCTEHDVLAVELSPLLEQNCSGLVPGLAWLTN